MEYFDWKMFYAIWGIKYGKAVPDAAELIQLRRDAEEELAFKNFKIRLGLQFFMATSQDDDILLYDEDGNEVRRRLPMLRQEIGARLSLSDYVIPEGSGKKSVFGAFAISVHPSASHQEGCCCPACSDRYEELVGRTVRMTLAEAASAWLDKEILSGRLCKRKEDVAGCLEGMKVIKPAAGYASCPDHSLKKDLLEIIPGSTELGISLTESYAMSPDASICGMVFIHRKATYPEISTKIRNYFDISLSLPLMERTDNKIMRRRLANAYLSSVISISLVLLLVGVAAMLLVNAKGVSDYFKENMQVSVLLKQNVDEDDALDFRSELEKLPYIKATAFISQEQGKREMEELLGSDFLDVFETSPIPMSIDITLNADYVSADSLEVVRAAVGKSPIVDEIVYQTSLVDALNANLSKISLCLGVLIVLLLFISFVLINNTVRLNVFARRFTIHTMKLVGATKSFIRAPFLVQAVFQGIFSSLIAILALVGILFLMRTEFAQLFQIFRLDMLLLVMAIVVASGILICFVSTWLVVGKLVSLKKDDLYY